MPFTHRHDPSASPVARDLVIVVDGKGSVLMDSSRDTGKPVLPDWSRGSVHTSEGARPTLVGDLDGRRLWLSSGAGKEDPSALSWIPARGLMGILSPSETHALSCGLALNWWSQKHRFCGSCGSQTAQDSKERMMRCPNCGTTYYPTASAAIIVAITKGEKLLLARNKAFRTGMHSIIAGFVDPGESLEQAVAREVREEVSISVKNIRYIVSQPWPFPNSLMMGFKAEYAGGDLEVDGVEIETADWYPRDQLPEIPAQGSVARQLIDKWCRLEL